MNRIVTALTGTALAAGSVVAAHASASAAPVRHTITGLSVSTGGQAAGKGFIGTDKFLVGKKVVGLDIVAGHPTPGGGTHVEGAVALAGGILYMSGDLPDGVHETGRVTGGTGKYRGAKGTLVATVLNNGDGGVQATIVWWK